MSEHLGVIFDIDGVLVDSYDTHFQSWLRLAEESQGHRMSETEFAGTFGRTTREVLLEVWRCDARDERQLRRLGQRKEAIYRQLIEEEFPTMPDALELIGQLKRAGFTLGLGSSGPRENVELTIKKLGQEGVFDAVVSGDDVVRGKPDPAVFLLAAERMSVPVSGCAVIEDSPAGIAAANAAGTVSVGLLSKGHAREDQTAADHIVERLSDLSPDILRQWIKAKALTLPTPQTSSRRDTRCESSLET